MADATSSPTTEEAQLPPMKPFRALPSTGASFLWGRYVQAGETVLLTETQAASFRDRFAPADDSAFRTFTAAQVADFEKAQAAAREPAPPKEPAAQTTTTTTTTTTAPVAAPETK